MVTKTIIIEDSADDALLLERALADGGIAAEFAHAETLPQLEALLDGGAYDLVISDYSLPQLSVTQALQAVQARALDIPFIVVSGRYGEEKAVETMRAGAHDYVPKDRLVRLVPAVTRELREAQLRRGRRELERYLGVSDPLRLFGRLAASLAHELSSPLTFMSAGLGVLTQRLEGLAGAGVAPDQVAGLTTLVGKLGSVCDRITRSSADFRALGAAEDEPEQPVALNEIVEQCVKLVQLEFQSRARVSCELRSLPECLLKVGRLKQALVNVLVHVAHALPRVAAGVALPCTVAVATEVPAGGGVRVTVAVSPQLSLAGSPGSDYGLFMGRRILELVGGRLAVEDAASGRIAIDLPLAPPA